MNFASHCSPQLLGKLNILVSYSKYGGSALEETKAGSLVVRHHCSPFLVSSPPHTHTHTIRFKLPTINEATASNLASPISAPLDFSHSQIFCVIPLAWKCLRILPSSPSPFKKVNGGGWEEEAWNPRNDFLSLLSLSLDRLQFFQGLSTMVSS